MADGFKKNVQVVVDEWKNYEFTGFKVSKAQVKDFKEDQTRNFKRLSKPSLKPSNRENFVPHVLTAVVSSTYKFLPVTRDAYRTSTYVSLVGAVLSLGLFI